jgi:hypothetical protein
MTFSVRWVVEWILYETAKPPASSAGEFIRFPEESLARLFLRAALALLRLFDAVVAVVFVFITTGILFFLLEGGIYISQHPCRLTTLVMGVIPILLVGKF